MRETESRTLIHFPLTALPFPNSIFYIFSFYLCLLRSLCHKFIFPPILLILLPPRYTRKKGRGKAHRKKKCIHKIFLPLFSSFFYIYSFMPLLLSYQFNRSIFFFCVLSLSFTFFIFLSFLSDLIHNRTFFFLCMQYKLNPCVSAFFSI